MLLIRHTIPKYSLVLLVFFTLPVWAETRNEARLLQDNMMPYSQHRQIIHALTESGTDIFATIQEVIKKLSADPTTDWSKVNLEALRQHLRDMYEFSYHVDVLSQQPIVSGVSIIVKPLTGRAEKALDKVLKAHPMMLKMETGWIMQASKKNGEYHISTTTTKPADVDKIRGLGYIGLLALGNHHQPHHWAMAKGQNPHDIMHH